MFEAAKTIFEALKTNIIKLGYDTSATDAEEISADKTVTLITQAGAAETRGLANGRDGQLKILINTVYAADTVVTPTALGNGTTITFNAAGDCWIGLFAKGEWHTISGLAAGVGASAVVG